MKEVPSHRSVGAFKESHPAVKIRLDEFSVGDLALVRDTAKNSWQFRAGYRKDFSLMESFSAQSGSAPFFSPNARCPQPPVSSQIAMVKGSVPSKFVSSENECTGWRGCSLGETQG